MKKKSVTIFFICLIIFILSIGATSASSLKIKEKNENIKIILDKITIYVDDDNTEGPWDGTLEHPYQYIQDGINNSENGYIIFVFEGRYHENLRISKSIELIGKNTDSTIIEKNGSDYTILVYTDNVQISHFTMIKSAGNPQNAKVILNIKNSSNCEIFENKFIGTNIWKSILLKGTENTKIKNNEIRNHGINLFESSNNNIVENNILYGDGIFIYESSFNSVRYNDISNVGKNDNGIFITYKNSQSNIISYNTIRNCHTGIHITSNGNNITHNNIISTKKQATIKCSDNFWSNNYWGRPRVFPKVLFGISYISHPTGGEWKFYLDYDMNPALVKN